MLGAVVRQSVWDAWQCGEDRTAFGGYCIETRRIDAASDGQPLLLLSLRALGAAEMPNRLFIAVALNRSLSSPLDISFDWVRAWEPPRTESPVGCVSRLMCVTHRPKPVTSPESRRAARLGDFVSC